MKRESTYTYRAWIALIFAFAMMVGSCPAHGAEPRYNGNKGKWGFVDRMGEWQVKPQYDEVKKLGNGYLVKKGDKVGFLSSSTEEMVKPSYDEIVLVDDDGRGVLVNNKGKWGFVQFGKVKIKPKYSTMATADGYLFCVSQDGKAGILDVEGKPKLAISDRYSLIEPLDKNYYVAHSAAGVGLSGLSAVGVSLMDKDANTLMPAGVYDSFKLGPYGKVLVTKGGKTGMLNENGDEIIAPVYDKLEVWSEMSDYYLVERSGKKGLRHKGGASVIEAEYDEISLLTPNPARFIVKKESLYGVVRDGKIVVPVSFTTIDNYPGSMLKVTSGGVSDVMSYDGKRLYSRSREVGAGLRALSNNDKMVNIVDASFNYKVKDFPGKVVVERPLIVLQGDVDEILTPNAGTLYKGRVAQWDVAEDSPYCSFFVYGETSQPQEGSFYVYTPMGDKVREVAYSDLLNGGVVIDSLMREGLERMLPQVVEMMPEDMRDAQLNRPAGSGSIEEWEDEAGAMDGSIKGLKITVRMVIGGLPSDPMVVEALFFDRQGNPIAAKSPDYLGQAGQMAVWTTFMTNGIKPDLYTKTLFIPNSEFVAAGVTGEIGYKLLLRAGNDVYDTSPMELATIMVAAPTKSAKKRSVKKGAGAGTAVVESSASAASPAAPAGKSSRRKGH